MPLAVEISIIAIAVMIGVLVAFLVPTIFQMRKTAKSAEELLTTLNRDLDPILKDLRKSSANLEEASTRLLEGAKIFAGALNSFQVVGEVVKGAGDLVKGNMLSFAGHVASLATGYKSGFKYFFEHLFKKKEVKSDE